MHIREHLWVPAVGLSAWSGVGPVIHKYLYSFPVDYTYPYWSTIAVCVFASVAPDLGNCGYYIAAYLSKKRLPMSNQHWKRRENRIFERIDRRSYWSWTYKSTHSAVVSIPIASVIFWSYGYLEPMTLAYISGHLLHGLMDHWSHRVSYILWPLWTFESKDPTWNWWHEHKKKPDV